MYLMDAFRYDSRVGFFYHHAKSYYLQWVFLIGSPGLKATEIEQGNQFEY